ncbi:hypothetical protein ACIBO1_22175 [Micromonospora sp. NPDC049903]|uniref:hypothetical protein n=1 Tax=Micromonospora sp. NPDC049903 TaxID=3364276 RepID=UPI0037897C41
MTTALLADVAETFERTSRVRIFDSTGPGEPHRKRRGRRPVLADQRDAEALTHLRTALALRPDTAVMDWMQWPDLWLELLGPDDGRLAVIGYLRPDWLRWESDGDLELRDPTAFMQWLTHWAPAAATTTAG